MEWVHLFSSTIRELYIADIIDVLGSPERSIFRFRYEDKYIDSRTRDRWVDGSLTGLPVAIYLSLQHPAGYHSATYMPIRRGTVVSTKVEGNTYVIRFRLGEYLTLEEDQSSSQGASARAEAVRTFTSGLTALLNASHPDRGVHATVGPSPEAIVHPTGNQGRDFESLVRYISPSLYFSPRTYFRLVGVTDAAKGEDVRLDDNGRIPLTAGRQYTLHISHYQADPPSGGVNVEITTPPGLMLYGEPVVAFRSRYDVIPVDVFAAFRDDPTAGEISVRTLDPSRGPTVRVPVTITPAVSHTVSGPLLAVGGAMALVLAPILGDDHDPTLRAITAALGTALVGLGVWIRRAKGLAG